MTTSTTIPTIVVAVCGPNLRDQSKGDLHVHTGDCADLQRRRRVEPEYGNPWNIVVHSKRDVVDAVYGDHMDEGASYDSCRSSIYFYPCCDSLLPEDAPEAPAADAEFEQRRRDAERNLRGYTHAYTDAAIEEMAVAIANQTAEHPLSVWHAAHIMATDTEVPCQCQRLDCLTFAREFQSEDYGLGQAIRRQLEPDARLDHLTGVELFAVRQAAGRQLRRGLLRARRRELAAEAGLVIPEDSGIESATPESVAKRDRRRAVSCIILPR